MERFLELQFSDRTCMDTSLQIYLGTHTCTAVDEKCKCCPNGKSWRRPDSLSHQKRNDDQQEPGLPTYRSSFADTWTDVQQTLGVPTCSDTRTDVQRTFDIEMRIDLQLNLCPSNLLKRRLSYRPFVQYALRNDSICSLRGHSLECPRKVQMESLRGRIVRRA